MVSGTFSLPCPGCFSPFPHGTSSLSVMDDYLALEDGPPRFPQGFTCPAVLGNNLREESILSTGLSPSLVVLSRSLQLFIPFLTLWFASKLPHNPNLFSKIGLGSFLFARRYWENRIFFLFLRILRWFTSPGSLLCPMNSNRGDRAFTLPGCPIRESPD